MTCSGCGNRSEDLKAVPGCGKVLYCRECRCAIASKKGRLSMSRRTSEERTEFGELGGNTLLAQLGVQYYSSLGKRSALLRARRRRQEAYSHESS
jgi:hypothetical protein